MSTSTQNIYRPDIDGLRSIAILTVLLFHAGYGWARGGYIGVDVFFVISGFLITRNIIQDVDRGTFTFHNFYARRIRRLFPALFFIFIVTGSLGLLLFSPSDLERLGHSLLYSVLSASNFFFWSEAGYFNTDAVLKPLLHTWSLSVEEQYYLVWPALLVFLLSFRQRLVPVLFLVGAGLASLLLSVHWLTVDPEATFFLSHFRIYEFAIGALCVWLVRFQPSHKTILEPLLVVGLGLIFWAAFNYTELTPFPGYAALVPCLGAALAIYAGQAPISGLILRNRVAVGIGLISYSLYLAHWPIMVFYKYWRFVPIGEVERVSLILASVLFGYIMWRFVETPFRGSQKKEKGMTVIPVWAPAMALLLSFVAANAWGHKGWPNRFPAEFFMSHDQVMAERNRYWKERKKIFAGKDQDNVIIMGNSHAVDLIYALNENGAKFNSTFLPTTHHCFNFGTPIDVENTGVCEEKRKGNFENTAWSNVDRVYLHDNWAKLDFADLEKRLLEIRELTEANIYVFGPKMTYSKAVPDIVRMHMQMSSINEYSRQFQAKEKIQMNATLQDYFERENIKNNKISYVDMLTTQCGEKGNECEIISKRNNHFLYFDGGHFTLQGATEFGKKLKQGYPGLF